MERHLNAKNPVSLIFAIPDHPWTKATKDSAAVRIAMTVGEAGKKDGVLWEVVSETGLETDEPSIGYTKRAGHINSDISIGIDVSRTNKLTANRGLASRGVVLQGAGFIVTQEQAEHLGLGKTPNIERHIRPYRNGRDLTGRARGVAVIDLFGMKSDEVRNQFPEIYHYILEHVKPERNVNPRSYRRENWWLFGENVPDARDAWRNLGRYVATVETAKHRVFQFLDSSVLPDNMLVVVAQEDAAVLAMLSSRTHTTWAPIMGGWLGYGNDPRYSKSRCFDPFPFPDPSDALKQKLRDAGEELDALRKRVLAEHPDLTLTGLYNVLEKLQTDGPLSDKDEDIKNRGLVLIIKELHDTIDRLTAEACGWPADLTDEQILERLVTLNAERAKEEAAGHVRWLRPDYQIPRFAKGAAGKTGELDLGETVVAIDKGLPAWPSDRYEQPLAVEALLAGTGRPMGPAEISRGFKKGGKRIEKRVAQVLTTLARYGRVTPLPGEKFAARKAA